MEKGYTKASNVNPMQQQNQDQEILKFLQSYSVRFPPHNSKRRIKYIFIYLNFGSHFYAGMHLRQL